MSIIAWGFSALIALRTVFLLSSLWSSRKRPREERVNRWDIAFMEWNVSLLGIGLLGLLASAGLIMVSMSHKYDLSIFDSTFDSAIVIFVISFIALLNSIVMLSWKVEDRIVDVLVTSEQREIRKRDAVESRAAIQRFVAKLRFSKSKV